MTDVKTANVICREQFVSYILCPFCYCDVCHPNEMMAGTHDAHCGKGKYIITTTIPVRTIACAMRQYIRGGLSKRDHARRVREEANGRPGRALNEDREVRLVLEPGAKPAAPPPVAPVLPPPPSLVATFE